MNRSYESPSMINSRKRRRGDPSDQLQTSMCRSSFSIFNSKMNSFRSAYSTDMFEEEEFISPRYSFETRGDQDAECLANALTINKVNIFETNIPRIKF